MRNFLTVFEDHLENLVNKPDDRPRKGVFHPSELAGCSRALYYGYIGAPFQSTIAPGLKMIFDHGHAIHHQIQGYLKDWYGDRFREEVAVRSDHPIVGNCDGVVKLKPKVAFGIEIKSINQKGYSTVCTSGPKPDHKVQANVYAACLKLPNMEILYYNKNDKVEEEKKTAIKDPDIVPTVSYRLALRSFRVPFDRTLWSVTKNKMEMVKSCAKKGSPPAREESWVCLNCKYQKICGPDLRRFQRVKTT